MIDTIIEPSRDINALDIYHLDYRLPLYKEGFPFVIFWSEKAACTVVSKWFFLQVGLLNEALKYSGWIHDYRGGVFQANKAEYLRSALDALKSGVPAVKFVRDPYARAYSGFLEINRPHAVTNAANWSTQARRQVVSELCSPTTSIEYTFSFRQYLLWRATKKIHEIDAHLVEQYIPRDDYFRLQIMKVEDGVAVFSQLEKQYNLPAVAADNKAIFDSFHHHKKNSQVSVVEAAKTIEFGVPLRRAPDFEFPRFDQEIAVQAGLDDLMRRSFGDDIEKYGYDAGADTIDGEHRSRKPANSGALSTIEIDAVLVTNRQLLFRCDQLESEREALLKEAETQKSRLDQERARPGPLVEALLTSKIFFPKGFLERREAARLRKLNFDEKYYVASNPDVAARAADPLLHFVRHGRREGRPFRLNDEET